MATTGRNSKGVKINADVEEKGILICFQPNWVTTDGVWQSQFPLDYSLPLFILQLIVVIVTIRGTVFILKPLRQPRVVSEIIGGVLLGPMGFGTSIGYTDVLFPAKGMLMLDTMANIGIIYYLFLVGVEMDFGVMKRMGQPIFLIAAVSLIIPFIVSLGFALLILSKYESWRFWGNVLFMSIAVSATALPVLARILTELKLFNTDLGKMSLAVAIINDGVTWIILAMVVATTNKEPTLISAIVVVGGAAVFLLVFILVVRPAMNWIVQRTPEGENFNEYYIGLILTGVMIAGFIADAIGSNSMFGAFIFGLVIPNGPLTAALVEKLEYFVVELMLPLFFAVSGLKINVHSIKKVTSALLLLFLVMLTTTAKFMGIILIALMQNVRLQEAVSLGMLLNMKGLIEMVLLNEGKNKKVIDEEAFTIILIYSLVMTVIASPIIAAIYKPTKHFIYYKRRTVQRSKVDGELRVVVCIHTLRNIPTMINLMEISRASKRSPIYIYPLHLVELTGHAMMIVNDAQKSGEKAINHAQAQSEHILSAFKNYAQQAGNVIIQTLTSISPYSTMHEDICTMAEEKHVALIIIPFHHQQTIDGGMEPINQAFRNVNQNVLANAPCSVGILIDRGIRCSTSHTIQIGVIFIGGSDDREALAYGRRMAAHPGVNLIVMRLISQDEAIKTKVEPNGDRNLTVVIGDDNEKHIDTEYISDFKLKMATQNTVVYQENVVNNAEETVTAIRSMDSCIDLYIVGKGHDIVSPLISGLNEFSEFPELGTIGDILASSRFAASVSILVVQQYTGERTHGKGKGTPDSPAESVYSIDSTNRIMLSNFGDNEIIENA